MDKNVQKRSLFDVYSSEEEEILDVNELQEEFENESTSSGSNIEETNEKCAIFGLEVGDTFEDWLSAERQVENHSQEAGFGIVRRRVDRNRDGEVTRRTFECQNSRIYCAKKKANVEGTRERESVKIGCLWKVNLSYSKGIIRVTSIYKEHNHPLSENRSVATNHNHKLSPEMLEEIEFLVNIGCGAGPIICALQKRFPDTTIRPRSVYNAICIFRRGQNVTKSDAAETYDRLMKLQREEHGWFVEARVEGEDNHLTGLFWMRPSQIELWQKYHDVAINDNTSQTNKYRMYLSLTIVVDNHARSRMVATAVVSDETKETYQWILECLLHATDGLAPRVLFTDADAGMIAAVHETLPSTKHNYCIWHIRKNIEKNLKGKLRNKYNNFVKDWNKCRNSFSQEGFQRRWCELLKNYPEAQKYLKRTLGTDVTSWALCFTHRSFNAGIQSTQRVESYNALIKKSVNRSTSLYELDTQIQLQLDKEEQFERLEEQTNQNPTVGLPNIVGRYFNRIDAIIKKYLTPQLLKKQRSQMNESLLYRVNKIENWEHLLENEANNFNENNTPSQDKDNEAQEQYDNEEQEQSYEGEEGEKQFNEVQEQSDDEGQGQFDKTQEGSDDEESDNERSDEGSDDEEHVNANMKQKDGKVEFAEDDYESTLSDLHSLISYLGRAIIHEVWSVTTIEQNKQHFVVLYDNANHLCTCMWLVTRGLVCRHFFSVMFNSDKAMFHIDLIPARWYNNIFSNTQEELAITICGRKLASDDDKPVYEHQIETNFDILNEIRHMQLFSETVRQNLSRKAKYNQGFGYAKRAIGLALEMGCENEINEILQNWIKKKEQQLRDKCITEIKENLPNISNPQQARTKGAPKKRIKNALENTTNKNHKQLSVNKGKSTPGTTKLNSNHHEPSRSELPREITVQTKYICSYCKGSGHNARSCEKKKNARRETR